MHFRASDTMSGFILLILHLLHRRQAEEAPVSRQELLQQPAFLPRQPEPVFVAMCEDKQVANDGSNLVVLLERLGHDSISLSATRRNQ